MPEGEDDGAGPLQNLEAVAELVRDGCGCNNANQFTTFEGVSIVDFQQQLTAMSSREVDLYLMGLLAARCTKCEPVRHHQLAAAAAQDRQRINNFWLYVHGPCCEPYRVLEGSHDRNHPLETSTEGSREQLLQSWPAWEFHEGALE